ncbi:MAG: alpha/beta fold hydrolase [Acidobacteria bacterium]|nr:MAG: alpha/beta fold hydrolase [Acidobacteriota bacterium]
MPIVVPSTYVPPRGFSNGHIQTLFPTLFRKVRGVVYRRERIDTPDGDFLDLDWSPVGSHRLAILSHGLEGNTQRPYMLGMVRALNRRGWDALAWNFRGCSGEPNRKLRSYHSGATDDLHTVVRHALSRRPYEDVVLIGFSLGGNLTLKYLGERGDRIDRRIRKAVAISVPCDLESVAWKLTRPSNRLYLRYFLHSLCEKIRVKAQLMPELISDDGLRGIKTFKEFDDRYTAPIHGFQSAEDYWRKCSSRQFLPSLRIPTLVVNARNDPLLTASCFPEDEAEANPHLFLEMPASGGHVGFIAFNEWGEYWSESRAMAFIDDEPSDPMA